MKTKAVVFAALVSGISVSAYATETKVTKTDVPAPVLKTVSEKYPKAEMTRFEKEVEDGNTGYEVTLKVNGATVEVALDADGKMLSEERRITEQDLPETVKKGLAASKYSKARLVRVEKVTETGKPSVYEILVKDGKAKRELVLSEAGEITKNEAPDEND